MKSKLISKSLDNIKNEQEIVVNNIYIKLQTRAYALFVWRNLFHINYWQQGIIWCIINI